MNSFVIAPPTLLICRSTPLPSERDVNKLWECFNDVAEGFGLKQDELVEICRSMQQTLEIHARSEMDQLSAALFTARPCLMSDTPNTVLCSRLQVPSSSNEANANPVLVLYLPKKRRCQASVLASLSTGQQSRSSCPPGSRVASTLTRSSPHVKSAAPTHLETSQQPPKRLRSDVAKVQVTQQKGDDLVGKREFVAQRKRAMQELRSERARRMNAALEKELLRARRFDEVPDKFYADKLLRSRRDVSFQLMCEGIARDLAAGRTPEHIPRSDFE
ncbi:hypothetical protein PHYSODRAFT_292977 [Phytophthora sojae]|uniref:Uncharacterized protein n=1 Tax=Phytophthora sojae (strain P6497) TaxID=1094619 RepID=G4YP45_PHYSP|nr:hypothetical protein PHYSODRAFT_292977 [Phytophthora sojae]EGZ26754.1 hypothetical protein PHYSODRAFT_292977 [Phytophthora sojae]|eukprot:XP_009514029.1 hypothetical protein PHYSODRAFT_292977 [Phytophthora sojae]